MAYRHEVRRDVIRDVTKYLPLQDYIRFGAIHPSWSAVAKARYRLPGIPLLIANDDNPRGNPRLFNVFSQKSYPLDLPDGYHCCGSSRGWLLIMDLSLKMCLWNPFSKTQIELPTFLSSESECRRYESLVRDTKQADDPTDVILRERLVARVVLSADPERCSDFVIMVIGFCASELKFWRLGDSSWTHIPNVWFLDVIWYNGAFHGLSTQKEVFMVCLTPKLELKKVAYYRNPFPCNVRYLVDCMGDLLIVERNTNQTYTMHTYTSSFLVYKLDKKRMVFKKVKSIGDHALFLGRNPTIAIPANKFPGCLSDSIYFTDNDPFIYRIYRYEDIGLYNMKNKIFEIFPPKHICITSRYQPLWLEACLQ
ncbi:F-box protein At2g26160-like [Dioscorea cayenensis subsp. rotundata]|uniref:F-box protein At2g26160-like n=1 Tax=Dioscorea cayennensis subsp. rotundata TaxID=55577 RepID=A0AB40D1I8_DIOCR|nr:F-box protein At2g26160-like [Dioscorea cayenensis subsp. rotundata]